MNINKHEQHYIYVDGSATENASECFKGGVGIVIYDADHQPLGSFKETIRPIVGQTVTSVRCEILALIAGLERSTGNDVIRTDFQNVVKSYNEWLDNWVTNGWRNSSGMVKNSDLWKQVHALKQQRPHVKVEWIKKNDCLEGNELASMLAREAEDVDDFDWEDMEGW